MTERSGREMVVNALDTIMTLQLSCGSAKAPSMQDLLSWRAIELIEFMALSGIRFAPKGKERQIPDEDGGL